MSFLTPTLRTTGPEIPYDTTSLKLTLPTPTNRLFQMLFVVKTAKISVKDLKQSRANNATSRKNW
jgi:hypothetical protein